MLQEQDLQAIGRLIDERAAKTEEKLLSRLTETEDKFTGRLEETEEYFNTRLEEMETRVDAKFQKTESRLDSMEERFECVEYRLDGIDTRLDKMDKRFEEMDKRFVEMEQHFDEKLTETANELYEEIGITQVYLEKKIDKIGSRVEDIWQFCRINKVENDRMMLLFKNLDNRIAQIE